MSIEDMHKLRIRYQKTGDLRFLSHLDLIRAFERGFRRAGLPLSLSEGFSPHPKLSFGPPLPVGVSSESEYLDVILSSCPPLEQVVKSLKSAFPEDLSCREARYVPFDTLSLMSRITIAGYRIRVAPESAVTLDDVRNRIALFLSEEEVSLPVKDGERLFEVEKVAKILEPEGLRNNIMTLRLLGRVASAGGVRPDILIRKLFSHADGPLLIRFEEIHRTGLYLEENGELVRP